MKAKECFCLCCHDDISLSLSMKSYKCRRGVCYTCYDLINNLIHNQMVENRKHCDYCFGDFESQCSRCIDTIIRCIETYDKTPPEILYKIFSVNSFAEVTPRLYFETRWIPHGDNVCDCDPSGQRPRCECRINAKKMIKEKNNISDLNLYEIADPDDIGYAVVRCDQCIHDPDTGNHFF